MAYQLHSIALRLYTSHFHPFPCDHAFWCVAYSLARRLAEDFSVLSPKSQISHYSYGCMVIITPMMKGPCTLHFMAMRGMGKSIIRNLYSCIGCGVIFCFEWWSFPITVSRFFLSGGVFKDRVKMQLMVMRYGFDKLTDRSNCQQVGSN